MLARRLRDAVLIVAAALAILAAIEGATRVALRLAIGGWPHTEAAALDDARRATAVLYRRHPFLLTAPREGGRDPRGDRIVVNSLGYRSPERVRVKPARFSRVVCAGGSTTWDPWASSNETTWPSLLERGLRERGHWVEVWNAGFPGWTSLENLLALSMRDLELRPDVVVLFQGINDLQPAAHVPFDADYSRFHVAMQLSLLGFDVSPIPWYDRLVLVERVRNVLVGRRSQQLSGRPEATLDPRRALLPEGVRVFERNVRSLVAVARAHGARVLLVTQLFRPRPFDEAADQAMIQFAIPDLEPGTATREIERLNDVLRAIAETGEADLADVARDVAWVQHDFTDPMHTSAWGSKKLAAALVDPVARLLPTGLGPE
jgi:lysophospholipase L1-like esterase